MRSFLYDQNGNLVSNQETSTGQPVLFAYDFENRLKSVTQSNSKVASYTYDGLGRRVSKTIQALTGRRSKISQGTRTDYVYDGFDILYESNVSDPVTKSYALRRPNNPNPITKFYIHGPRIDEILGSPLDATIPLYDGLGSTRSLTNFQGQPVSSTTYDVFGSLRSQAGTASNSFLFTGRELDQETNLYYYRNRYYNPSLGRFITKDPIGLRGGINQYTYVDNNPVNYTDPYGLTTIVINPGPNVPPGIFRKPDNRYIDYIVGKYGLDRCQRDRLHRIISKECYSNEEIEELAAELVRTGEGRCGPRGN